MPINTLQSWFLKKHENGEVFGPVRFDKIREWAQAAQVSPQDLVSTDQVIWTRAPMIPDLDMDWLVEVGEHLLYGPTTSGALIEFITSGEISADTLVINCANGSHARLKDTDFYNQSLHTPAVEHAGIGDVVFIPPPVKGGIRANLQRRVRDLEQMVLEKTRYLNASREMVARLELRNKELEEQVRELAGFSRKKP